MTGNLADATIAYNAAKNQDWSFLYSDYGTSRFVFLINDVIYKVQRSAYYSDNVDEYHNLTEMPARLPEGITVPDSDLYWVNDAPVLAMEFIDGIQTGECLDSIVGVPCECKGICLADSILRELNSIGWTDQAWGNAIREYETGILYLVDVVC